MLSPLRRPWTVVVCLLALTLLTATLYAQSPQDVTTWHNDNYRTGWQQNETTLTPSNVSSSFGLLWQWSPTSPTTMGYVFAQPLAVGNLSNITNCSTNPCNLVFVADEQDMLWAFDAALPSSSAVWYRDLAGFVGGTYVTCTSAPADFPPCSTGVFGPTAGVTGTPVIDTSAKILYAAAAVYKSSQVLYYLFAVDMRTGNVLGSTQISGSVIGQSPDPTANGTGDCTSVNPGNGGLIQFDYHHIQRSALLLLPNNGINIVYVAFSGGKGDHHGETTNGWMFGYSFSNGGFAQQAIFNSTPYGTGGGIWQSGAGPAVDHNGKVYVATANGTLFDTIVHPIPVDIGDSLVQFDPTQIVNGILPVTDYYAPPDGGMARCLTDTDFGSGGVLVVPPPFTYTLLSVIVNADKESKLYVTNQASLGKYNANGVNDVETVTTPCLGGPPNCPNNPSDQGYWSSPAYWYDGANYWLYYSPTVDSMDKAAAPYPIYAYKLTMSGGGGPISQTATAQSVYPDLFCPYTHTPSVSSDPRSPTTTGIVWTIELQNSDNNSQTHTDCNGNDHGQYHHAALHALIAESLTNLYDSAKTSANQYIGHTTTFSAPTVFNGQVYIGTQQEVDVFGLCQNGVGGNCK